MLKVDKKKRVIYAYQNECALPKEELLPSTLSDNHKLAMEYYFGENGLKKTIEDYFIPQFKKQLNITDEQMSVQDIKIVHPDPEDIRLRALGEDPDKALGRTEYRTLKENSGAKLDTINQVTVLVKFSIAGYDDNECEYIPIMELPWVNENGIIEFNQKEYTFVHMLEQTDGISYSPSSGNKSGSITIRTNRMNINIFNTSSGIVFETGDGKYNMCSLVGAYLNFEGGLLSGELREIWDREFSNDNIVNLRNPLDETNWRNSWLLHKNGKYKAKADLKGTLVPKLAVDPLSHTYDSSKYVTIRLRDTLNKILSLDQAKDRMLAKDVFNDDGVKIASKGEPITNRLLNKFKENGVYCIHVRKDVNIVGVTLAKPVIFDLIPKGTLVSPLIERYFPEETGMYTMVDHHISECKSIEERYIFTIMPTGEPITMEQADLIMNSGVDNITISVMGKEKTLNFYEEIISNKQFKGRWLGKTGSEANKWYYKTIDGKYVDNEETGYLGYTAYDILSLWSYAVKLLNGDKVGIMLPNIDEDFRKNLVPIDEQFNRAVKYSIAVGMNQMKGKFTGYWKSNKQILFVKEDSELVDKFYTFKLRFWEYLTVKSKCVKIIPIAAYNNPLAYISEITKANVFIANKHSISDTQRTIPIGSYGKIDPYEIPQSSRLGVVNNITTYCKIEDGGKITTPYYKVYTESDGRMRINLNSNPVNMTIEAEEEQVIADIVSIKMDKDGYITDDLDRYILCRVPGTDGKHRQSFEKRKIKEVKFVNTNALQPLSWSCAAIPFLCNNDAARAVFAVAQMKQAKGLAFPEVPYVMTSAYELIPRLNNVFGFIAKDNTYISYVGNDAQTNKWKVETTSSSSTSSKVSDKAQYDWYKKCDNSVIKIKPEIIDDSMNERQDGYRKIENGRAIVSSNFVSSDGFLQFGRNALVLFIPDGYNYEDSVHISKSFSRKMESYRINSEHLRIDPGTDKMTGDLTKMPRIKDHPKCRINTTEELSPKFKHRNSVYITVKNSTGNATEQRIPLKEAYGSYINSYAHKNTKHKFDGVVVNLLSKDYLKQGDKLSNRHGNKGTVCKVSEDTDMPIINNGRTVDVVLNPLGVGSRMNIGQIKEATLGLIAAVINYRFSTDAYNTITDEEIRLLLLFVWRVANLTPEFTLVDEGTDERNIYEMADDGTIVDLRDKVVPGLDYPRELDDIMNDSIFRIIPEDIKDTARRNITDIQKWRNTFDEKGRFEYSYIDSETRRVCRAKAFGGFIYMFKLTQESHEKIHARANDMAGERYSKLTDSATKGASHGGGQRMGTMEIDALCAYGASGYIRELLNQRGDNAIAREDFNCKTYFDRKEVKDYIKDEKGQRRSVTQLLYMLLSLGIYTECDNGEIIKLSDKNGTDLSHVNGNYLQRHVGVSSTNVEELDDTKLDINNIGGDDGQEPEPTGGKFSSMMANLMAGKTGTKNRFEDF